MFRRSYTDFSGTVVLQRTQMTFPTLNGVTSQSILRPDYAWECSMA